MLLPELREPSADIAIEFGEVSLSYADLATAARVLVPLISEARRVAVWATPTPQTCVAVVAGLLAGVPVVPVNPKIGERELAHIVADSEPEIVLAGPDEELPDGLGAVRRVTVDLTSREVGALPDEPDPESPAFVVYTSGTTGPPKGVVLPRRAVAASLDALAIAWEWTAEDTIVHALPLFHVHGLILGVVGPLRRGGAVHHLGRFSTEAMAAELAETGGVMFGVPTMYHRLAADCERDPHLAKQVSMARLLISGSAALPVVDHERITTATGKRVIERYGMTETLMICGVPAGAARPGSVGPALSDVDVRVLDESGEPVPADDATVGEIEVRGPNLFAGYLNRPDATEESFVDGWFRTGDMATVDGEGYLRIVGRKSTDLIKSGGYKIGAGEIENALLEHPAVAEAAVTGEPDPDLGERIVAWVVAEGEAPDPDELADHVARLLSPHKRPRVVRFLDALPRNDMGKVTKRKLAP
ncbi:malonyl-CoA/methylmalonyl-CoA synthetase [Herbihabitans rhizosphaerae]|uniref:Malonyl-CoA/methylmalonyl-CoA synthetase n=1 Tax=Herbihabitans rhizosphaerae TaxID=1872711 RepID=A0A4V2ESC6_9PSEU|nr:acyl-CoA synthetase [Herbihabitans rhizosphaerae]RZS37103.1 malonyl-CoA/methylmalonyl-CoA synthetase [Herbihabitans rhizosphaerae]